VTEPIPLEQGSLDPPDRNPPTAVGTATPPPPFRGRFGSGYRRTWVRIWVRIAVFTLGGSLLAWLAPWRLLAVVGLGVALTGPLVVVTMLWSLYVAPRLRRRRENRWIRLRQAGLPAGKRPAI